MTGLREPAVFAAILEEAVRREAIKLVSKECAAQANAVDDVISGDEGQRIIERISCPTFCPAHSKMI